MSRPTAELVARLVAALRGTLEQGAAADPRISADLVVEIGSALGLADHALLHSGALQRQAQLAELGRVSAEIVHELRQPLVALKAYAEMFPEFASDQTWVENTAGMMLVEARRMAEMIDRVQRYGRVSAGRRAVDLNEPVRAAAELLRPLFRQRRVRLDEVYAEAVPTVADAGQVQQVTMNLLANAAEAARASHAIARAKGAAEGDDTVGRVVLRTWGRSGQVCLEVEDSGPGVAVAVRERIFEPFFTTKADGSGTGLGLAISRVIAQEHGGTLELASADPGQTVFRLTLPGPFA